MPMDKEVKHKWVEALRSGDYEQGRYRLRNNYDQYCCLGVLCEVIGSKWEKVSTGYKVMDGKIGSSTSLPLRLGDEIGLLGDKQADLVGLNDEQGKSFDEIADYIEENL